MTTKTLTFTAQIEYDPSATSVENMAAALHVIVMDALDSNGITEEHGELSLDFSEADDGEAGEESPPKLFDEHDAWTDYGRQLAHRIARAVAPIAGECLEDGVDLRHAAFIAQQEVEQAFLKACMNKRLGSKE
jgi:hypothetical protein